jgi:hypothetical protein
VHFKSSHWFLLGRNAWAIVNKAVAIIIIIIIIIIGDGFRYSVRIQRWLIPSIREVDSDGKGIEIEVGVCCSRME